MEYAILEQQQGAASVALMQHSRRGCRLRHVVPIGATAALATSGVGFCARSASLSGGFMLAPGRRHGSSSSSGSQADTVGLATAMAPEATFGSTATAGGQLVAILIGGFVAGKLAGRHHGRAAALAERSLTRVVCRAAEEAKSEVAEAPPDEEEGTDAAEEATKDTEESAEQDEPEKAKAEHGKKKKAEKWICSGCGAKNFPQVFDCHKCGNHRPSKAEEALLAEKAAANDEIRKVMDDFLRAQADLQNYRRQHTESMSRAEELGKQDALKDLVPFSEDIAAALVAPENMTERETALFESYTLLFRKVDDAYTKFGVERTDTKVGDQLDPVMHLKVDEREAPGDESPGTILEVVKQGFKCDGKTIIPSEVAIVAFPAEEESAPEETADGEAGDGEEMAPEDTAEEAPATEEKKEDEPKTDE